MLSRIGKSALQGSRLGSNRPALKSGTRVVVRLEAQQLRNYSKKNKYAKNDQEFIRAGRQETEELTEEEKLKKRQEEKEKKNQPVKKTKNPGRGVEGKFVYAMQNVYKYVNGDRAILDNVSLSFFEGAKIGILGVNGSGKSSLIKILAGVDDEYEGEARPLAGNVVGYLPQEPELDETKTVKENVYEYITDKKDALDHFLEYEDRLAQGEELTEEEVEYYNYVKGRVEDEDLRDLDRKVAVSMNALRCPPPDHPVTNLSGGEKRRVALCRLLISNPDILLLDEPTNHLDAESVAWLERYLAEYKGAVLAVTHDRYFLDNVAGWILEIDRGRCYPFEGNYSQWLQAKQTRLALEAKKESVRNRQMREELEWISQNPKGRQAKSKARIGRYEDLLKASREKSPELGQVFIPPGPKISKLVIKAENLTMAYGDKLLFENLSFKIEPGAIVGIIGSNGSGKTTLFNIITGKEVPDSGTIQVGDTVKLGFAAQMRDLKPEATIFDEVADGEEWIDIGGAQPVHVRAYLAAFSFKGDMQNRLVGDLSGGERNRVHLAKMLKQGCNVIMLDEPSNDLDVDTLRSLEEALVEFAGCALVISHDRWFLDRICTHIIAFEGNSNVVFFDGNYSAYEKDRKERLGTKFDPSRIKFRRLEKV